jgi:hypothetical protein
MSGRAARSWKRNAPEIPAIEVKKEMTKAIAGGINIYVFIPATGNITCSKSIVIILKEFSSTE